MVISGWGRYPKVDVDLSCFREISELQEIVAAKESLIARGMGRSYGDSALSESAVVSTNLYNKMLAFDEKSGVLTCESGVTIAEILDSFVGRGWFIPVTPGTKFVSIGGAIASDVHGKNHHKVGSFSSCVISFTLLLANGDILECSREKNYDIFKATFGGMGLTGVILETTMQLKPISSAYIFQKTIKCRNLEEVFKEFESHNSWTYSVAWIDCLAKGSEAGRSLLMLGEHAEKVTLPKRHQNNPYLVSPKTKLTIPFSFPSMLLNKYSVKTFNELYYLKRPSVSEEVSDYDSFFYPLDAIHSWNKIYGKKGFVQYQCVLPLKTSYEGILNILNIVSEFGMGSFLAVLKLFGKQEGVLSFPMEGYTLALDFPVNKKLFQILWRLDDIVQKYGGKVYLTKDARMTKEFFENTYDDNLQNFRLIRSNCDTHKKFQSLQSMRLGL